MALPILAVIGILPTVAEALGSVATKFAGNPEKIEKIVRISSQALDGVEYAVEAFQEIKASLRGGKELVPQQFDDLISKIDANTAKIDELAAKAAKAPPPPANP